MNNRDLRRTRAGQKTYWHLLERRRIPNDYEIVSSRLRYSTHRSLEVNTPAGDWLKKKSSSGFVCADWEAFADPRATTYSSYVSGARDREDFVERVLGNEGNLECLSSQWIDAVGGFLATLRYPAHGLQMAAASLGHVAPCGRVTQTALYQAADEMRRVHRLAYRLGQLRTLRPSVCENARESWQKKPSWQPLREVVEHLLAVYDFDESFVALNLVFKPLFDHLTLRQLSRVAQANADEALGRMLESLWEDAGWHQTWSVALVRLLLQADSSNLERMVRYVEHWLPTVQGAVVSLSDELSTGLQGLDNPLHEPSREWHEEHLRFLSACGLTTERTGVERKEGTSS